METSWEEFSRAGVEVGGGTFVDRRGLHLRLSTETFRGLILLNSIGGLISRPVEADGAVANERAWLWITVPMSSKAPKLMRFGNKREAAT